ncbi:sensor histidine kinase [Pseudodesulfovibrio sp. zrk46]|uniref:sensor histidine kinase n=1 Tax=Pseudodesulfovibrio sp. zrk46 TaxID=2725288 RepID=UPI00144A19BF|nr:sensor histidine kinase [Pseudodesulfovibrio sp. zrk46]QJB57449.1 two-component sensor histidine kinase [Pseudodesulfovibrio sp. zrk46]
MHPDQKATYDKLSRNIALTVITVSIAPLILVGGLIFDQMRSIYREKVYSHLAEVVDKHKDTVDSFLQEKLNEVHYLGRAYSYEQLTDPVFLQETLRGIQQQFGRIFVDIGVIDENGRQIAYAGPYALLGADYSAAEWYRQSRNQEAVISDVILGLRQSPHFFITINNDTGGKKWTLRVTIDFLAFSHLVENIRIGETGSAYILNNQGVFQTKPLESYEHLTLSPVSSIPLPELSDVSIGIASGSDGEDYLEVASPLNNGNWRLVYLQRVSDAFSAMTRAETVTLLIFLVGGIAIVVTAIVISRQLVVRFKIIDRESELMSKQMVETGKLAAIGELAAGIAHEINNPVAIMIEEAGWVADIMEDEGKGLASSSEIDRALQQVATQGRRCKDITHKLLSFARQTDSRVTNVVLPALIREVVDISMQPARYGQVDFDLTLEEAMPPVRASVTELHQVFLNLVNNAIQAMETEGGGTLSISCRENNGVAEVVVADDGPGIPAANLNRVFDPFFTTKPVGKGSGLGLSICFGIIHQMGGEIDVESGVGQGTRFNIRLPYPAPVEQANAKELHHD